MEGDNTPFPPTSPAEVAPPIPEPAQPVNQTPVKPNNFLVLLLSVLLVIAVAIAGFFYFQIQKLSKELSKYQTQPSPAPFVSPEPSAEAETADWKTYLNEKYGFEIKYYPESNPNEFIGNSEAGQFTYLFLIKFGTNPIKSPYGYELKVNNQKSLDDYRTELVGHITDRIDSEEETVINNNTWKKINYKIFVTTDYVPITIAIINRAGYSFAISSSALDIDQILSTFKFLE